MAESGFINLSKKWEESAPSANSLDRQQRIEKALAKSVNQEIELPQIDMMQVIGSYNSEHFLAEMTRVFRDLTHRFEIEPDSTIFGLGSGCGRTAYPFLHFLNRYGRYISADVWTEGIQFQRKAFKRFKNIFQGEIIPVQNNYYFDQKPNNLENSFSLSFCESSSVDLFYAISVFSHLKPADFRSYLQEAQRVLKPGGVILITLFVIDDFFFSFRKSTGLYADVKQTENGFWSAYSGQDFFAGFEEKLLQEMFDEAQLAVVTKETGSWAKKPGFRQFQDTYVLRKAHQRGDELR
jgi:SAM-dependent methyltransferase